MHDALILGVLKLNAVKRLAHDTRGAILVDLALIGALVAAASIVALVLANDAMDWVLSGVSGVFGE